MKPTKEAVAAMTESVLADLAKVRGGVGPGQELALAGVETFVSIAIRVFAKTNVSKLRDAMRTVEIAAHMNGAEVIE